MCLHGTNDVTQMDQRPYPGPPLLFHFRMVVLFSILYVIDLVMFFFTVEHTLSVGVGGMVLFASEVMSYNHLFLPFLTTGKHSTAY